MRPASPHPSLRSSVRLTAALCLILTGPAVAATANGVIPTADAQSAAQTAAAASNSVNANDIRGLDTKILYQTFDVQHQQMMTLTTTGLGINVGTQTPDPVAGGGSVTQALDVAGYVRVRPSNYPNVGSGGVIEFDGAVGANGQPTQRVWMQNNGGTLTIMDDGWDKTLFTVDQTGNATATGNVLANGELQTIGGLRLVGGGNGTLWANDGTNSYITLTNQGQPFGPSSGLYPFAVSDATGVVVFGDGVTITGGGVTFPDASVQATASNYGGEYSQIVPAAGGSATCNEPNYKSGGCSCPPAFPNAHQFVNFQVNGTGTLQVYSCSSD